MKNKWLWLVLIAAVLAVPTARVLAQDPTPVTDDQINEVARQLYCPVCENITLEVCSTTACAQWRSLIAEKLSQGWTPDQIKQYFVDQYGDRVLAEPPKRGLNWLVYLLPPVVILAAGVYLVRAMKQMKKPAAASAVKADAPADPYLANVEEELRRRREQS
jgi:cytochrome c-type biogenesis protein CcmH